MVLTFKFHQFMRLRVSSTTFFLMTDASVLKKLFTIDVKAQQKLDC